jgi:TonB family protein
LKLRMRCLAKNEWLSWRSRARSALATGLALMALGLLALGQQQNATEDQVKAAYLLNFAKLAEWPARALPDGPSPLVIGVAGGDEEFLNVLRSTVAGKIIGTHLLVVKLASSEKDMKSCHMVFFRASEKKHTHAAIEGLAQASVLLVGEDESFLQQGGMINLVREKGSVRFEVNPDALDRTEIHLSAKILALAKTEYGSSRATAANSPATGTRQLERSVPPQYPDIAERMNLKGTVQVQALVRPDGTVKDVKVLGGHPLLADALVHAVMQWKYQAGSKETVEVVKFSFGPQ